ncbi:plastocyanin [Halomonas sp. MCCC 1A17488]|uniref:cupredoxin domain-containing protein n=1 Tax=unclassified Halomonas TaxID=2609666 RepID=UPI0018D23495|nr:MULTISPECIES: plastocyanin/azurin family copper-binding protein [unclassified Halomonas]MCE8017106.1 plastocyanin [Halomonas sp. MCCC 1A17488]MCG3240439.1 plastocyanin [Halomonas sp. MCCC 1A17488]QPP49698.1 cupredoxin domain-containing protein [Halomonas sp. SS10-MC5]
MATATGSALGTALATLLLSGAAGADNGVVEVEMRDYGFHPAELEVEVGTTVRWANVEKRTSHDVYFHEEDLGSERLFPEENWERTFDEPGTYPYHCRPHESRDMEGVVVVVPAE